MLRLQGVCCGYRAVYDPGLIRVLLSAVSRWNGFISLGRRLVSLDDLNQTIRGWLLISLHHDFGVRIP